MLMNGDSQRKIAKEFNVAINTIASIQKGETWKVVEVDGFTPFYKNQFGSENINAKLTKEQVREIKILLLEGELKQTEIAKKFNIDNTVISGISLGKLWKSVDVEGFVPIKKKSKSLTDESIVKEIKKMLLEGELKQIEIAKKFNVSTGVVSRIKLGKTWKEVTI